MEDNAIIDLLKKKSLNIDELCKRLEIRGHKEKKKLRYKLNKLINKGVVKVEKGKYSLTKKTTQRKKDNLLKYITIATSIFIFLVLIKTPYLNGPNEWAFPYFPQNIEYAFFPILLYLIFLYLVTSEKINKNKIVVLILCSAFFFLFQTTYTMMSPRGINSMPQRIKDHVTTGYYTRSLDVYDYTEFLRNFPDYMKGAHSETHPPGAISFFYFANKTLLALPQSIKESVVNHLSPIYFAPYYHQYSAYFPQLLENDLSFDQRYMLIMLSILIPLFSSLIVPATYFAAKNIFSEEIGIYSAIFATIIPSFLIFAPIMDQIFAIFPILSVGFLYSKTKKWKRYLLSGTIFSIGLFFTFGILILIPMFLSLIVFFEYKENKKISKRLFKSSIKYICIFIAGILLLQLLLYIIFGYNSISTLIHTKSGHNVNKVRTYSLWVVFNLIIFFIMIGIPITVSFFHFVKTKISNNKIEPFSFLTLLTLLLLDISGIIRGEVERIWMFFMPFFLIVGVYNMSKIKAKNKWKILISLQFACSLVMKAMMRFYL